MDITVRTSVPTVLLRVVITYTDVSVRLPRLHQLSQVRTYPLWWHSHMCISFDIINRTGHSRRVVPMVQSGASYKLWKLPSCFSPNYFCTGASSKGGLLNMSGFSSRLKLPPIFCVNWSIDNQLFNPIFDTSFVIIALVWSHVTVVGTDTVKWKVKVKSIFILEMVLGGTAFTTLQVAVFLAMAVNWAVITLLNEISY